MYLVQAPRVLALCLLGRSALVYNTSVLYLKGLLCKTHIDFSSISSVPGLFRIPLRDIPLNYTLKNVGLLA